MKTKLNTKILAALLALVLFLSCCPVFTFAELFPESFQVTFEGEKISEISFFRHEKKNVSAENLPEGCAYQWQIRIPGTDMWVDIQGQTNRELAISYALVGSLLDAERSAYVRCAAVLDGTDAEYTKPLRATVTEEPEEAAPAAPKATVPAATEPVPEVPEATEAPAEPVVPENTEAVEETLPEITEETAAIEATEAVEETSAPTEGEVAPQVTEETLPETTEATAATEATEAMEEASAPVQAASESETTGEPAEEPTEEILDGAVKSAAPMMFSLARSADAEELSDETEIVSVTIEYYYEDRDGNRGEMVMDPYVARIVSGGSLNVTVPCRIFPGYEIKLVQTIDGVELKNNGVVISLANVTADQTVVIHYKEIQVQYHARFFLQNVYNDLYTESTDILTEDDIQNMKGYAGGQPDESLIHPEIPGFTALFHQPDKIAADGSTVFEVYYDRNYYLINFDMDGGYGTAPVYARFETTFNVSQPTKAGNSFSRWELVTVNGEPATDAQKAEPFLSKIPDENRTYKAVWIQNPTTYTVAYWILDGEGNKTFLGSSIRNEQTGKEVTGGDDLDGAAICGYEGHTHGDSCMSCRHWHTDECVNPLNLSIDNPSGADEQAISALGEEEPENGYIYAITVEGQNGIWCRLRWNDQWYGIDATRRSGDYIKQASVTATGAWNGQKYNAEKYYAQLGCDHAHENGCQMICESGLHKHIAACYVNDKVFEYLYSDPTVKVEGDGSTVVNVYYQYKEYTLKFYYAATTGGEDKDNNGIIDADEYDSVKIVGGSTYYFGYHYGTNTADDKTQLKKMYGTSSEWGEVDELPTLTEDDGAKRGYTLGTLVDDQGTTTTDDDVTFHYISFKARYNDDISSMWPCGVFNSVTRTDKSDTTWSGKEAFVSAWNGEYHVAYSRNENETIKGIYEKLDDNLLFHSDYGDDYDEVSYLCFWENGADIGWSVPELYIYSIWLPCTGNLETNAPIDPVTGVAKKTRSIILDGEEYWYYLHQSYNTYDDSRISNQTEPSLTGYGNPKKEWGVIFISNATMPSDNFYVGQGNSGSQMTYDASTYVVKENETNTQVTQQLTAKEQTDGKYLLYDSSAYDPENYTEDINHTVYREAYFIDYFYEANVHILYYWNHDGYLTDGRGVSLAYGTPLKKYGDYVSEDFMYGGGVDPYTGEIIPSHYPDTLEPDAYYFDGWYTTPECYQGTEMNWDSTMPDADLTVYAKWTPVTHNAYFYMDYDRYAQKTSFQKVEGTAHGTAMVTSGITLTPTHDKDSSYQFVGWFYINADGEKVAFNPAEMAVRQELHLYAEWSTKTVKEYTVSYALGKEVKDAEGNVTIVAADEQRLLSADTTGYAFEASTRTFAAKPGEQLEKLTNDELNSGIWVPHTNSHSILMKSDNSENVFTFWYVSRQEIPYVVRYLDASTHEPVLLDGDGKEIQGGNQNNTAAVVTEQFVYVPGYIPDAFHKTLILSANDAENIIYFYYTKDENYVDENDDGTPDAQSARYLVTHWVQDIGSEDYSVYTTDDLVGIVGTTVSAEALTIPGFTFDHVKTGVDNGVTTVSGTVTTGEDGTEALQLNLYYTRNTYDYTVYYREQGTTTDLTPEDGTASPLTVSGSYFDDVVTVNSKEVTGYDLISAETQTLKIGTKASLNTVTFFYTPKTRTVYYVPVCTKSGATDFGYVLEDVQYAPSITGTSAVAELGYKFVGWYEDAECKNVLQTEAHYTPQINSEDGIYEYTFYALFEPIDLKVTYDTTGGDPISSQTSHIGETVTLPAATYEGYTLVSWWYDADEDGTVDEGEEYAAGTTFTMPGRDVTFVAQWVDSRLDSTHKIFIGINLPYHIPGATYTYPDLQETESAYHVFPDEPLKIYFDSLRAYYNQTDGKWHTDRAYSNPLTTNPWEYIDPEVFSDENFQYNYRGTGSMGLRDPDVYDDINTDGSLIKKYFSLSQDAYNGIIQAWIDSRAAGASGLDIPWENDLDVNDFKVVPYVIKMQDDGNWYVDMVILAQIKYTLTYESNMEEGYSGATEIPQQWYGQYYPVNAGHPGIIYKTDAETGLSWAAKFLYWEGNDGERYDAGEEIIMDQDLILTAVWDYPLIISQTGMATGDTAIYQIVKSTTTDGGEVSEEVVLTVALNGEESVSIYELPAGDYTVREITGWTWKYSGTESKKVTVTNNGESKVAFKYVTPSSDWLSGENFNENQFAPVTTE